MKMKNYNSKKLALMLISSIHGSGIDYDYTVTESQENIIVSNAIHCMDEWGGYDGVLPFQVLIDKKIAKVVKIKYHGSDPYHRRKYVWKYNDYLYSQFLDPSFSEYERPYYLKSWEV